MAPSRLLLSALLSAAALGSVSCGNKASSAAPAAGQPTAEQEGGGVAPQATGPESPDPGAQLPSDSAHSELADLQRQIEAKMLELADLNGRIWNELIEQGGCDECWIPYAQFEGSELEASDDIFVMRGRTDEAGHVRMGVLHIPRDRYPEAYAGRDAIRSLRAKPAARAALQDEIDSYVAGVQHQFPGRTITQKPDAHWEKILLEVEGLDFQPDITRYSYPQAFSSGDLGASLMDSDRGHLQLREASSLRRVL
ncbi:MAG: hypothetical protein R3F17_14260 [Planctomycetota bacterium]